MGKPNDTNYPWLGGDPTDTFSKDWKLKINKIPCAIYQAEGDGIIERNDESGRTATVQLICNWNKRIEMISALLGTVDYADGKIVRQDPFSYPVGPNDLIYTFADRLIATSISSIRGMHWWTDTEGEIIGEPAVPYWGAYVWAVLTVEFTSPLYWITEAPGSPSFDDLLQQTYCITKIKAGGEVFAPPTGSFVWAGGGGAGNPLLDVGAAHIRTRSEISCTRIRMPIYPGEAIQAALGSVNDRALTVGDVTYPRGSVLFNNVVPEPRSDPIVNGVVWDLEMVFLANAPAGTGQIAGAASTDPLDWNYFLDPEGNWQPVYTKSTNKPPFKYVDWTPGGANDLFTNTIA